MLGSSSKCARAGASARAANRRLKKRALARPMVHSLGDGAMSALCLLCASWREKVLGERDIELSVVHVNSFDQADSRARPVPGVVDHHRDAMQFEEIHPYPPVSMPRVANHLAVTVNRPRAQRDAVALEGPESRFRMGKRIGHHDVTRNQRDQPLWHAPASSERLVVSCSDVSCRTFRCADCRNPIWHSGGAGSRLARRRRTPAQESASGFITFISSMRPLTVRSCPACRPPRTIRPG
ncbi:hypothetical protein ebA6411 [Aromatoleum aromaticum EbN1]|uniref:Uncharacterized protein n=1 Tax=Aromatoleum aromaticum (strain DSM 19018 / LMG 30748 / EbN1) TaxID=76114 RepID=Q5NYS1_AROAE|nr:hypothetical protein ebA6411 [Aromatoleum aromaticum EbN1]